MEHFKLGTARGGELGHNVPQGFHVDRNVVHERFLILPIGRGWAGSVSTGLRHWPTAISVNYLQVDLLVTVVVAIECLLPGRCQVLDGGLGVVVAREDVEQLRMVPAKLCEPVLIPKSHIELVAPDQPVHLFHL